MVNFGYLAADDDTLATDATASTAVLLIAVLGFGAASLGGLGDVAAAATTAVQLDAVTLASDAVTFTAALHGGIAHGGQRRGRGRARGAGRQRGAGGAGRAVGVRVLIGQTGAREATGEVVDGGSELSLAKLTGSVRLGGLGVLDSGGRKGTASCDAGRGAVRLGSITATAGLATGDIEDVKLAAGGGLDGVLDGGIVRDTVAIHDIVIPVTAAELQHGGLEAELAQPCTRLVLSGQRQLTRVVVPRADQVDGPDVGRGAQGKLELNGGHYEDEKIEICKVIR